MDFVVVNLRLVERALFDSISETMQMKRTWIVIVAKAFTHAETNKKKTHNIYQTRMCVYVYFSFPVVEQKWSSNNMNIYINFFSVYQCAHYILSIVIITIIIHLETKRTKYKKLWKYEAKKTHTIYFKKKTRKEKFAIYLLCASECLCVCVFISPIQIDIIWPDTRAYRE